jgi:hypothetical protein
MIPRFRPVIAVVLSFTAWLATSSAHAQYYGVTNFYGGSNVTVTDHNLSYSESTLAGPFTTTISQNGSTPLYSMTTYCVDLFHYINGSSYGTNEGYQAANLIYANNFSVLGANGGRNFGTGSGIASPTATQLGGLGRAAWLVDNQTSLAALTGGVIDQAALQLAVWKAEYETDQTNFANVSGGAITFSGNATMLADATRYLQFDLNQNGGSAGIANGLLVAYQGDGQDQLAAVPTPATMAMSGTSIVIVSSVLWFRGRGKKATLVLA